MIYYPEISNEKFQDIFHFTETLMKYVYFARDLQNKPSNELTPKKFVEIVRNRIKQVNKIKFKSLDFEQIKKLNMGG